MNFSINGIYTFPVFDPDSGAKFYREGISIKTSCEKLLKKKPSKGR
jgi:hypothetical protein